MTKVLAKVDRWLRKVFIYRVRLMKKRVCSCFHSSWSDLTQIWSENCSAKSVNVVQNKQLTFDHTYCNSLSPLYIGLEPLACNLNYWTISIFARDRVRFLHSDLELHIAYRSRKLLLFFSFLEKRDLVCNMVLIFRILGQVWNSL